MNKRRRIAFVVVLAVLAAAAWFAFHSREPEYQGRKLSEWLPDFRSNNALAEWDGRAAAVALKHMGAKAIPYLLDGIQAEDWPEQQKVANWLNENLDWHLQIPRARDLQESATVGFFLLGELGEPAIPALARAITNNNHGISSTAAQALGAIGSTNCVPVLIRALTNADATVRQQAASSLTRMGGKARAAGPIFLARLNDNDPGIRTTAIIALANIGVEPLTAVAAVSRRLADDDAAVRACAAGWLGAFGSDARSAIAALQQALQDPDEKVREAAARSLIRVQCEMSDGGIVRGPKEQQRIALAFTGHEFADGGETILNELEKHQAKASFFFTGDFATNPRFAPLIQRMTNDSHYLGPHSDKHLLYCDWSDRDKTLVTRPDFWFDLLANLKNIEDVGVKQGWPRYFLPPYEHYNREIADWSRTFGFSLITFTPGTQSNADYTGEADKNFVSSQAIFDSIVKKEREDPHGLNGFILLLHLGSGPGRADKFHTRFGELLDYLTGKGYQFVRVDELLEPKPEQTK